MLGPPVMGVILSVGQITSAKVQPIVLLVAACFFLVAHVWTLNDWAEISTCVETPKAIFPSNGIRSRNLLYFSIWLLVAGMGLFSLLGLKISLIAAAIVIFGFIYSLPCINSKGRPLLSSLTHFAGGMLHFLLGYSLFAPIDRNAVLIASFFALAFTAGHVIQEVQDYDADMRAGIRTNAVAFGKVPAFIAGCICFTLAYGDFLWLSLEGFLPRVLWLLPATLFPLHLYWSLAPLLQGLDNEQIGRLRYRYRVIFAVIGIGLAYNFIAPGLSASPRRTSLAFKMSPQEDLGANPFQSKLEP